MAEKRVQRRLAAILAADVVGYSRLMREDETGTLAQLKTLRKEVFDPRIAEHNGRIVKTTGDGVLVEFASAVDATECAVKIQRSLARRNEDVPEGHRIELRIGINLGDIIVDGDDIYGDGVNVAARLEGLCDTGEVFVSAVVHDQVEGKIQAAFDDLGERTVKNIDKPVRVYRARTQSEETANIADTTEPLPVPDKPSIAVLPFENMSGDPEQEYFSDGIAEDIITALSRIRWFLVIARNSSFSYKGTSPGIRQVARELGVRYVLEGSVRKAANRVRITAQLIDAADGSHIWAERYDRDLEDIFTVQDEITETVVRAIEPELSRVEQERARRKRPDDLDAWDCYQRGMWHVWRTNQTDIEEGRRFFLRATEIDPSFASGYAGLALARLRAWLLGFSDRPADDLADGVSAANTALLYDERDATAYAALALGRLFQLEFEAGLDAANKAIDINPNYAPAHLWKGMSFAVNGQAEEALTELNLVERLSPRDPMLWLAHNGRAMACLTSGDNDGALSWTRKSIQHPNASFRCYMWHAITLAQLGRADEAREAAAETIRLRPDFSLKVARRDASGHVLKPIYIDSLRAAGVPE